MFIPVGDLHLSSRFVTLPDQSHSVWMFLHINVQAVLWQDTRTRSSQTGQTISKRNVTRWTRENQFNDRGAPLSTSMFHLQLGRSSLLQTELTVTDKRFSCHHSLYLDHTNTPVKETISTLTNRMITGHQDAKSGLWKIIFVFVPLVIELKVHQWNKHVATCLLFHVGNWLKINQKMDWRSCLCLTQQIYNIIYVIRKNPFSITAQEKQSSQLPSLEHYWIIIRQKNSRTLSR